jgi:CheY-like chemotaxis protein
MACIWKEVMHHAILLLPASAAAPGPLMHPEEETGAGGRMAAPVRVLLVEDEILRPDLVLMDIRLARGTDGIQAAGEIRARLGIGSLYLSAHTDAATLHRAQATRPLGFVAKPYTRVQLEAALRAAVAVLRGGPVQ